MPSVESKPPQRCRHAFLRRTIFTGGGNSNKRCLTITMSKLSRPGILEDPPEFYTDWATNLLNVPLFFCNVSELCHISQKKLFWRVITQSFEYVFTMKRRPSTQMLLRNIAPSSLNWPLVTKNILCLKNHLKLERSNFFGSELLRESLWLSWVFF